MAQDNSNWVITRQVNGGPRERIAGIRGQDAAMERHDRMKREVPRGSVVKMTMKELKN